MDSNTTLWQFLLELLVSNKYNDIIQWTNDEGEFKLFNPEVVANLWGRRKKKLNMTYDKLSRALRYYYNKNIIKKVNGQKFMYKFVSFPEIVKMETKVPFKQKMETLAHEYGQQVFPHLASYSVKSSARKDITSQNLPVTSKQTNVSSHVESEINTPSEIWTSGQSQFKLSENQQIHCEGEHKTKSVPTSVTVEPSVTPNSSTNTSSFSNLPHTKQQSPHLTSTPLILKINQGYQMFAHPSPKFQSYFNYPVTHIPLTGVPRTPLPLHFWSSLSPITTMSPRVSTPNTTFQFPVANVQLSLPNFSAIECLN